jgi:hypothetical protein
MGPACEGKFGFSVLAYLACCPLSIAVVRGWQLPLRNHSTDPLVTIRLVSQADHRSYPSLLMLRRYCPTARFSALRSSQVHWENRIARGSCEPIRAPHARNTNLEDARTRFAQPAKPVPPASAPRPLGFQIRWEGVDNFSRSVLPLK